MRQELKERRVSEMKRETVRLYQRELIYKKNNPLGRLARRVTHSFMRCTSIVQCSSSSAVLLLYTYTTEVTY
jgi:hypothetical protein